MVRRSSANTPERFRQKLIELLSDFEGKLVEDNLREQVLALVPANHLLRDLGSSLIPEPDNSSARSRILAYLRKYPGALVSGDELMVVAGISEYARRIRELRVEHGWPILTGLSLKEAVADDTIPNFKNMVVDIPLTNDSYVLLADEQDRDAAYRWRLANDIRRSNSGVKDKLLRYFRENTGKAITGEELKYLANNASEWGRRVRELRTEEGWPIMTQATGMPHLPVGIYVLAVDRQAQVHDRRIPDLTRVRVLERDGFKCSICDWCLATANPGDRFRSSLELHHIVHHVAGGENSEDNLITLCNICHDEVHRGGISEKELRKRIEPRADSGASNSN